MSRHPSCVDRLLTARSRPKKRDQIIPKNCCGTTTSSYTSPRSTGRHRVRRDIDRIARVQHLRLLAFEADAADAGQTEERLPNRVGVPRGACSRRERNDRASKTRGRLGGDHRILGHDAGEVLGGTPLLFRAPARMTSALTGKTVLLQWQRPGNRSNRRGEHSGRGRRGARRPPHRPLEGRTIGAGGGLDEPETGSLRNRGRKEEDQRDEKTGHLQRMQVSDFHH